MNFEKNIMVRKGLCLLIVVCAAQGCRPSGHDPSGDSGSPSDVTSRSDAAAPSRSTADAANEEERLKAYSELRHALFLSNGRATTLRSVWGSSSKNVLAVGTYGAVLTFDGSSWIPSESGTTANLLSVWGSGPADVFAVGSEGKIIHYDGTRWRPQTSGITTQLNGVWGSGSQDVYSVGQHGVVLHFDGARWQRQPAVTRFDLVAIWGSAPDDVYAVGDGDVIIHRDGKTWSVLSHGLANIDGGLQAIWGSDSNDVYAVGRHILLHYDGNQWEKRDVQLQDPVAIWGSRHDNVYILEQIILPETFVLHFDGQFWSQQSIGTRVIPYGMWGAGSDDLFVVGDHGAVLRHSAR